MKTLLPLLLILVVYAEYTHPETGARHRVPSPPLVLRYKGDVTGDDKVNLIDALFILRWVLGGGYPELQKEVADVNGNGRADVGDAVLVLRGGKT